MKEASLYEKLDNKRVKCQLCTHRCLINDGKTGICGVRENQSGTLISLVYEKVVSGHCDPIEKKPLFHFLPGSTTYSIATVGCNFKCSFCQNFDISQMVYERNQIAGQKITPEQIVNTALAIGASSISYTYTEPTVYFELANDTAKLAMEKGLKNIFVSNGYMTDLCLKEIYPNLHGANIDLKAFSDKFYKERCGGRLEPVLNTLSRMTEMGIWVEVTTLLIPGLNDSKDELKDLANFLKDLNANIPWHISRFHPTYRLKDIPATPSESVQKSREIGYEAGLKYVYTGNLPGEDGEKTYCHACNTLLINRVGYRIIGNRMNHGYCPECGEKIPGFWNCGH